MKVKLLDFDSCLATADYKSFLKGEKKYFHAETLFNQNKAILEDADYIYITSNRQSLTQELKQLQSGGQPILLLPVANDLAEMSRAKLVPLLFPDIIMNEKEGATLEYATKEESQCLAEVNSRQALLDKLADLLSKEAKDSYHVPFDELKVLILFAQIQDIASKFPNEEIVCDFYDDNAMIINANKEFFEQNSHLIPNNVKLNLYRYQTAGMKNDLTDGAELQATIPGTGIPINNYQENIRKAHSACVKKIGKDKSSYNSVSLFTSAELSSLLGASKKESVASIRRFINKSFVLMGSGVLLGIATGAAAVVLGSLLFTGVVTMPLAATIGLVIGAGILGVGSIVLMAKGISAKMQKPMPQNIAEPELSESERMGQAEILIQQSREQRIDNAINTVDHVTERTTPYLTMINKISVDEKVKQLNQHTTSELNDQKILPENIDKHLITKDTPENTINMAYEATFFRGKRFADNCTDAEIDMRKQALSETHQATLNNVIELLMDAQYDSAAKLLPKLPAQTVANLGMYTKPGIETPMLQRAMCQSADFRQARITYGVNLNQDTSSEIVRASL